MHIISENRLLMHDPGASRPTLAAPPCSILHSGFFSSVGMCII
jgi:hypothetical protein